MRKLICNDEKMMKLIDWSKTDRKIMNEPVDSDKEVHCICINNGCKKPFKDIVRRIRWRLWDSPQYNGCKSCSKAAAGRLKTQRAIEQHGSLAERHPELAKEWNYNHNDKQPEEISGNGGSSRAWWKCEKCGYEWSCEIRDRVKGSGCNECYKAGNQNYHEKNLDPIHYLRAIIKNDPILSREYSTELNGPLELLEATRDTPLFWKCKNNEHEPFRVSVKSRKSKKNGIELITQCSRCAKHGRTYIQDALSLYVIDIFGDENVLLNKKHYGYESDIFIKPINTAIEIDGAIHNKWKTVDRDKHKNKIWRKNGINVLRLRDSRITNYKPRKNTAYDKVEVQNTKNCLKKLSSLLIDCVDNLPLKYKKKLLKVIKLPAESIQEICNKILNKIYDKPIQGESLLFNVPWIKRYWSSANPAPPDHFVRNSNMKVEIFCPICGIAYPQIISNIGKYDARTGKMSLVGRCCSSFIGGTLNQKEKEIVLTEIKKTEGTCPVNLKSLGIEKIPRSLNKKI